MAPHARRKKVARVVVFTLAPLVVLFVLYLVVGNVLLSTGALRSLTNVVPDELTLDYRRAWTVWPTTVHAREVTLRFQDANVQFGLQLEELELDVALAPLLRRRFHATRVRGTDASWRMLLKGPAPGVGLARLAASPTIEGFERDPVRPRVTPPHPALEELWSIELDDVEATVREVWVMEFAWTGVGQVDGAFALEPLRRLEVRPAHLALEHGTLKVGEVVASRDFSLFADVYVAPYDIETHPDLEVFRPLSASVQLRGPLDDVAFVARYLPGVAVGGRGALDADLRLISGRLGPATTLALQLDRLHAATDALRFDGVATVRAALAPGTLAPTVRGELGGVVKTALDGRALSAVFDQVELELVLSGRDLVDGLALDWARAHVIAARVDDARPIRALAATRVAVLVPELLGDGPLIFSGSAWVTPAQTLVHLTDARLGTGRLRGVAVRDGGPWRAAAAGQLAGLALGARLMGGELAVMPFVKPQWLGEELERMRLDPNLAEPSPLAFNLR